ncbi:hypothetical protein JCM8097_001861 [Rhodosporidiobolus ruineniae]
MAHLPKRSFVTRFTSNQYIAGALPTIGGIMFGADISSMAAQLSNPYYLKQFGNPDSDLQGGITASMPAGSFGGALINSWLSDKIGRKKCIIISGWLWVLGCIIQSVAQNVATLVAGRVVAGLAVGIASAIVTVYQAEITKPNIRGRIVSIQQLAITVGIFLQYFVQYGCSYIEGTASFRLPWALQLIPGLILGTLMFIFPESPRWLMEQGRNEEALQILADVHAAGDTENELVQLEYREIFNQIEFDRTQAAHSYLDLIKPDVRKRVFLGMAEQMWSQLTGMVFQSAGLNGRRSELIASSIQYALNVAFTLPALVYIDRWGRRPMMLYGAIFMAIWLCLVGAIQAGLGQNVTGAEAAATTTWRIYGHTAGRNAVIVFSYFFVCSFAITWGPCSWTYASEIFPTRVRGKAVSMATATNSYATPPAFHNVKYRTYFIFMTFNIVAAIHIFFMYPETKGRTLEEMDEVFQGNTFTAWRIPKDAGKKTLADLEAPPNAAEKPTLQRSLSHHSHGDEEKAPSTTA